MNYDPSDINELLNQLTDGLIIYDKDLRYVYVNKKATELLKREAHELIGKKITDVFPESENLPFYEVYKQAMLDGKIREWEEYLEPYNRWFYNIIYPSSNGIRVFFKDISERKNKEIEIAQSNERLLFASKATDDIIWDWNLETNEIWWNDNFKLLLGYKQGDIKNQIDEWNFLIHPDDSKSTIEGIHACIDSNSNNWTAQYRVRKANGEYALIFDRAYIIRDENGKGVRMIGAMMDITVKKYALEKVERLLSIIEATSDLVMYSDENRNPIYINKAGLKLLEIDQVEGFLKQPFSTYYSKEEFEALRDEAVDAALANGIWSGETTIKTTSGKSIPVSQVLIAHKKDNSNLVELSTIIRDNSVSKKSESDLRLLNNQLRLLSSKLNTIAEEERSRLAREIHDDIGQQLLLLKLDLQRLALKKELDSNYVKESLEKSILHVDKAVEIVQNVSLNLHPQLVRDLGLKESIEWYVKQLTERAGIPSSVEVIEEKKITGKDSAIAIFRIVQESLTNAIKYSKAKNISIKLYLRENNSFLEISDDGIGFEINAQEKHSLGLIGMQERTQLLGGEFILTSSKGNGTKIRINLPTSINH